MKILFIFLIGFFLMSCGGNDRRVYNTTPIVEKSVNTGDGDNTSAVQVFREDKQPPLVIHIITHNGHQYMLARKNEAGGLTHLEDCKHLDHD